MYLMGGAGETRLKALPSLLGLMGYASQVEKAVRTPIPARLSQALREVQNLKLVTTVNSVGNRSKTQETAEMRTEMANRTNVPGGGYSLKT